MRLQRSVPVALAVLTCILLVTRNSPLAAQGVAPCAMGQLAGGAAWQGATGALAGPLVLENLGSQPCTLAGPPAIALADGNEQPLDVQFVTADEPDATQTVVLQPGDEASTMLFWRNWCGDPPAGGVYFFLTLQGKTVAVGSMDGQPLSGTPRCDNPPMAGDPTSGVSTLTVGGWASYPPS